MNSCLSKSIVVLTAGACIATASYLVNSPNESLPIIEPSQVNPELVDESMRLESDHRVKTISLWDQKGNITDSTFTDGKLHVADFFFTTCKTICPRMSASMESLANRFDSEEDVRFLSFSVLPEEDSIPALREYAIGYNADYEQWRLLTGMRSSIYALARKSYFTLKPAEVGQGDGDLSDFIHTNNFVLVDRERRIRGYYDGTSSKDMERLHDDIKLLLDK